MKFLISAVSCLCVLAAPAAEPLTIKTPTLEVALDSAFPRVIAYQTPSGRLAGQTTATNSVELNGKASACEVTLSRATPESAVYTLKFSAENIAVEIVASVSADTLELRVSRIVERGAIKLKILAFPDNALLFVDGPDAAIAACHATNTNDRFAATFRERITPLAALAPGDHDDGNYLFVSAGPLAAGLACNNFTDVRRCAWKISQTGSVKSCAAQNPVWEFRKFDDEPVPSELPWVKVFITPDLNGDHKADWQDAALVYRRSMPMPFGHETVKDLVGENIAMNFASGAQQPFLKILDELKKIYLATDGLPNQVNIKGFSSEGHDSANTDYAGHWNERAGGLRDLNFLLERAATYHSRIGIHINASEAYPEAHRYLPEILRNNAQGGLAGGWTWLDQAYMIDKEKDVRSGSLFRALEQMRKDLPALDFVYVDTYWENGWPAAMTARKINSLGLAMYSEGDCCLDPWIVWGHWRGGNHTIQRFLWFSERDLFANDPILRGGRADADGFMGWQNQHDFHSFINRAFSLRLPAKWLQHFELLRWVPAQLAEFSGGVKVEKQGNLVTVSQNGKTVMTWTGDGVNPRITAPWPPAKPEKIYVWSATAGDLACDLPQGFENPRLYRLSDRGRGAETVVNAAAGKALLVVEAATPYVLYPSPAPAQAAMQWGEGGWITNPGFDSYDLTGWDATGPAKVEADAKGNPRLILPGDATAVSQSITGLKPGATYAATVWALATGGRSAGLDITCGGRTTGNYVTRCDVRHSAPNDSRTGTRYQRLRVVFTAAAANAILTLKATPGAAEAGVEFDDVRIVETDVSPEAAKHFFWEDFENVESGGYGPFTGCPGERTHLSEANPPHTRDTISGRFSLKSRDAGQVLRTLPSSLRLKPATKYRLTCQTIGQGRLSAISQGRMVMELKFPNQPDGKPAAISGEFITRDDSESYLALFRDGGDAIVIDDLAIDELGPATAAELAAARTVAHQDISDEMPAGLRILLQNDFSKPLDPEWTLTPSQHPGTSIGVRDGGLVIAAYANISILAERPLPAGVAAVEARLKIDADQGLTWGPGLALIWPGGEQLRINLRSPEGRFGIDSTAAAQKITGQLSGDAAALRIRLDDKNIIAEARCAADGAWQQLATFPSAKFPGAPAKIRLGKTHGVEALDDNADLGAIGTTTFTRLRLYQR